MSLFFLSKCSTISRLNRFPRLCTKFIHGSANTNFRPKINPADEIRTEFKKLLAIGLKTSDYSLALAHAKERLEYNVIDNGKSVNGKLIATILNVYSKSGEFDKAFDLFNSIRYRDHKDHPHYKHLRLSAFHYQLMLDGCVNSPQVSKVSKPRYQIAQELLNFMINKNKEAVTMRVKCKTPLPTAVHFTSAITSCLDAKQYDLAYETFLLARDQQIIPDTILFNTALKSMIQLHLNKSSIFPMNFDAIMEFFHQMEDKGKQWKEDGEVSRPAIALPSRRVDSASNKLTRNSSYSPKVALPEPTSGQADVCRDSYTYGIIAKYCARLQHYDVAHAYLLEANRKGLLNKGLLDIHLTIALKRKDTETAEALTKLIAKDSLPNYIIPQYALQSPNASSASNTVPLTQLTSGGSLTDKNLSTNNTMLANTTNNGIVAHKNTSQLLSHPLNQPHPTSTNIKYPHMTNQSNTLILQDLPRATDTLELLSHIQTTMTDAATANTLATTSTNSSIITEKSIEQAVKHRTVLDSDNQLIRRSTHNITGTTNKQMLNQVPIASYTSQLYQLTKIPVVKKEDKGNTNMYHAMKVYNELKQKQFPITTSQLANVMTACAIEFHYHADSKEYVSVPTSKYWHKIDELYQDGLKLKLFTPLKVQADSSTRTSTNTNTVRIDLRKLPYIDIVRTAAIRHLMNQLLPAYCGIVKPVSTTESDAVTVTNDKAMMMDQSNPMNPSTEQNQVVVPNVLLVTGQSTADRNKSKPNITASTSPSTTSTSASTPLCLKSTVKQVLSSLEPNGIITLQEFKGNITISQRSLQVWFNTQLAMNQLIQQA